MKKHLLALSAMILVVLPLKSQDKVYSSNSDAPIIQVLETSDDRIVVKFALPDVYSFPAGENGEYARLYFEGSNPLLKKGAPEVPVYSFSIATPWVGESELKQITLGGSYSVLNKKRIVPSKGTVSRIENLNAIPYEPNEAYYTQNWPNQNVQLKQNFAIREMNGLTVQVLPIENLNSNGDYYFQTDIVFEITPANGAELSKTPKKIPTEFNEIYKRLFVNYSHIMSTNRYAEVSESGRMLIIAHPGYDAPMAPFIAWKKQRGLPVEMVTTATTGTSQSSIASYIQNYYTQNPDLVYVLLVGDAQHIPARTTSVVSLAGDSDNAYAYLVGSDHYPEVFVGRFSAESVAHVETQVARMITYEKNPAPGDWIAKGVGIASNEGPGDNGEMDFEHVRLIRSKLMDFTYRMVDEFYDGTQGGMDAVGNPSANMVVVALNGGRGVINYTGHGWEGGCSSSGLSSSHVNSLTNVGMLPFFWSVACVNGNFVNQTCFAEVWLRATHNNQPSGAIGTLMSTVNQYWNEPMAGQDEMNDILTEIGPYSKRTFGGISMHGCMHMNDKYGQSGYDMTDTWTLFGDPSLLVRTDEAANMNVTHVQFESLGVTNLDVYCNVEGAFISLTQNNEILATGIINGGTVNLTFPAVTSTDNLLVTATAFNHNAYQGDVLIGHTAIGEANLANISVYPNPTADFITINGDLSNIDRFEILDISGRTVLTSLAMNQQLDLRKLSAGQYTLRAVSAGQTVAVKVIQKN